MKMSFSGNPHLLKILQMNLYNQMSIKKSRFLKNKTKSKSQTLKTSLRKVKASQIIKVKKIWKGLINFKNKIITIKITK